MGIENFAEAISFHFIANPAGQSFGPEPLVFQGLLISSQTTLALFDGYLMDAPDCALRAHETP